MEKLSNESKLNDLLRIDIQNLYLCRHKAAINPASYDYMPFVYNCVVLNELYILLLPEVVNLEPLKTTVLHHCNWILTFIGKKATADANTTYTKLREYIALRQYLIEQIVENIINKEETI